MKLHPILASQLRERMKEFKKNHVDLWSKVVKIVEELGEKEARTSSAHTTVSYELSFQCDSSTCLLYKSNYAMGGDYIFVHIDGKTVLSMGERSERSSRDITTADRARMVKIGEQWYLVESYIPGPWESWLNLDKIKEQLDEKKSRDTQVQASQRKKEAEQRPLNNREQKIAKDFGFPTH